MIYLDTNILYYASEVSENTSCNKEKLQNIIKDNDVAISIATMYELVFKWRNEIEQIHKIGSFLGDNHIKIAGNPYYELPDKLPLGWNIISEKDKEDFIEQIIPKKIDVEARLSSIVFSICFISIADFLVQDASPNGTSEFYMFALRMIMKTMNQIDIEVFRQILEEGYNTDDCENYLRKCFDNYMEFWLQCFVPILQKANEVESYEEYLELEENTDWEALSQQLSKKISKAQTTMEFIKKRARQHWKSIGDVQLGVFLVNLRNSINKKIPHESTQEYLTEIVGNILLNGASFWKNDIIDAIIMSHIRSDGDILLTFDQGAIKHMEKHKNQHAIYESSLKMIQSLQL